jgi:hypothetical protein
MRSLTAVRDIPVPVRTLYGIYTDIVRKILVSPWQEVLCSPRNDLTRWISILKLFIQYGADVHAYIENEESDDRPGAKHTNGLKPRPP